MHWLLNPEPYYLFKMQYKGLSVILTEYNLPLLSDSCSLIPGRKTSWLAGALLQDEFSNFGEYYYKDT